MFALALMFLLHFIADFIFQSREMGKKKSYDFLVLLNHINIQFWTMWMGLLLTLGVLPSFKIAFCNMVIHGVIDWYIWRAYKIYAGYRIKHGIDKHLQLNYEAPGAPERGWLYWEDHWFYTTIGFDQMLHGLTLIVMFGLFV